MASVINLLECAKSNIKTDSRLSKSLAIALIEQYQAIKAAGFNDSDDVDEIIINHPELGIKMDHLIL